MRRLCATLIVAVLGIQVPAAGVAGATDVRIEHAREQVRAAEQRVAAAQVRLDRAAAEFEAARAHAGRLADERDDERRRVVDVQRDALAADQALRRRVAALYKHPELRRPTLSATLSGDDVGEVLHRAELMGQLARSGARRVDDARRTAARVRGAERDYRVVSAGVTEAVRVRRDRAADLGAALASADRKVREAEETLREVTETVAAEIEAERRERLRRERARRAAEAAAAAAAAPPQVVPTAIGDMVCPIGAPNAFSDTWGAPRSGGRSHQGVDMFAAYGMPLYAVADGTVRVSTNRLGGLSVHLDSVHGDRYYYAHLSAVTVEPGQAVRAGDQVGENGNSGNARATPPHLHWQYHPGGGAPVNPYPLAAALCRG